MGVSMGMGHNAVVSVVVAGLVGLLVTDTEAAGGAPDTSKVYVESMTYGGSGAPQGSVGNSFSNDRTSITLIFDHFVVSSGPGVPNTEGRKNAQLNLNLRVPNGWTYSIASVDFRGYVQLPAGVTAEIKATSYFQGEVTQSSAGASLRGPVDKDYLVRDTVPQASQVWMPCGRVVPLNLNLNVQARLLGPASASAQLTTDRIDGKVKMILGLQWRRC